MTAQYPYHRIGNTGSKTAQQTDQRRNRYHGIKARPQDKQSPDKCQQNADCLIRCHLLLQQKIRGNNGKKRRHLVQHVSIRYMQMVDSIKVTDQPCCSAENTQE